MDIDVGAISNQIKKDFFEHFEISQFKEVKDAKWAEYYCRKNIMELSDSIEDKIKKFFYLEIIKIVNKNV